MGILGWLNRKKGQAAQPRRRRARAAKLASNPVVALAKSVGLSEKDLVIRETVRHRDAPIFVEEPQKRVPIQEFELDSPDYAEYEGLEP